MGIESLINDDIRFSKLKVRDKIELLSELSDYLIPYRSSLNFSENITFGLEMEYESLSRIMLADKHQIDEWRSCEDPTLSCGGEIKSPVLTDKDTTWEDLQAVCALFRINRVDTFGNCGGHIHFGKKIFDDNLEYFRNFLKLIMLYEPILFYFGYGDKLIGRRLIYKYAPPIASSLYKNKRRINKSNCFEELLDVIPFFDKNQSICFKNLDFEGYYEFYNTIEFRFPNSSSEEVIWQNNINVLGKLLMYACSESFDKHLVDYRLFVLDQSRFNKRMYESLQLDLALEFADLIFTDTLDKVNFLKQYYKLYREDNNKIHAKKFVKSISVSD